MKTGTPTTARRIAPIRQSLLNKLQATLTPKVKPESQPKQPDRRRTKFPEELIAAIRWDHEHGRMNYSAIVAARGLPDWRVRAVCEYRVAAHVQPAPDSLSPPRLSLPGAGLSPGASAPGGFSE